MKICFNQATTMKYSTLEKDLEFCEKHGYDLIEIRIDKLEDYLTRHTVADLASFFESSHLKPYAFNALEFITFQTEEGFQKHIDALHKYGAIGKTIGCSKIVVVPTFDVGDLTIEEIKQESISALNTLADIAKPYGLKLAYEFVGYPSCSVNTFGQTYAIVDAVNRDDVGMVLDCFHFHAMNSSFEDLENADINRIFIFHIDDCDDLPPGALRDNHRVWPGDGAVDLDRIITVLKGKGYSEMASVELFRPEYWEMDIESVIKTGKEKTLQVLGKHYGL